MFGGDWTEEKLRRVQKYLKAYNVALKRQPFTREYIDAFAGTGYREVRQSDSQASLLLPELVEEDCQDFLDGSASIALKVEPPFPQVHVHRAESRRSTRNFASSGSDTPDREINTLQGGREDSCRTSPQPVGFHRAVLFVDPFGMQVTWETIRASRVDSADRHVAPVPPGVAVSRLLKKDGRHRGIPRRSLDVLFGETSWFDAFYKTEIVDRYVREEQRSTYKVDFRSMETVFHRPASDDLAGVAENPLQVANSKNVPSTCSALRQATREKGAPIAVELTKMCLNDRGPWPGQEVGQ